MKKPSKLNRSRLIIVTNREPFHLEASENGPIIAKSNGGLVSALEPAMQALRGLWLSAGATPLEKTKTLPYDWQGISYPEHLHDGYYIEFSNRILWPLFHSMLGNLTRFDKSEWDAFSTVNQIFADALKQQANPYDIAWIHDYHLSLVPYLLRNNHQTPPKIGFFLHIPFPSLDIFRVLPWNKQILQGMLGADFVAFHIETYVKHFFDCVEQILKLPVDRDKHTVQVDGRVVQVKSLPIGIDVKSIYQRIEHPALQNKAQIIRQQVKSPFLICGVDRLDYTKGIYKRLKALERFFALHPNRREQVSMIQLVVPSRTSIDTYQSLRAEIEQLVGHINGIYGTPGWTPITYMYRSLPDDDLFALYHAADIALVTPLRDGMNLVAKEYVASHQNHPGVLILSDLAGACEELSASLLVNPYDVEQMAQAIEDALNMGHDEKKRRMRLLNQKLVRNDVHSWANQFVHETANASNS